MKKIYQNFNHLNIDMDIEPMEVSAVEKERIKRTVIKTKKKKHVTRNFIVAASLLAVSSITIGSTFPAFAANIPIIGSLFELFTDNERYVFDNYDEYSTIIGMSQESNGVEVTVTDAVYDGENITVAYTIKSDMNLGERPVLAGELIADEFKDRYRFDGYSTNNIVQKISDNEYAVLYIYELIRGSKPDEVHITLHGDQIADLSNRIQSIQGDWSFTFTLDKLESESQKLAKDRLKTEVQDIKIAAVKLTKTPISTAFYLTEEVSVPKADGDWRGVNIDYRISDNLGNAYNSIHYKGTGHSTDFEGRVNIPRITVKSFDEKAKTVKITPVVSVYKLKNQGTGELELVEEPYAMDPIEVPIKQ